MENPRLFKTILTVAGIYICYVGLTMFGFLFNDDVDGGNLTVFRIIAAALIVAGLLTVFFTVKSSVLAKKNIEPEVYEPVNDMAAIPHDLEGFGREAAKLEEDILQERADAPEETEHLS